VVQGWIVFSVEGVFLIQLRSYHPKRYPHQSLFPPILSLPPTDLLPFPSVWRQLDLKGGMGWMLSQPFHSPQKPHNKQAEEDEFVAFLRQNRPF
jgi:hypothetical protein